MSSAKENSRAWASIDAKSVDTYAALLALDARVGDRIGLNTGEMYDVRSTGTGGITLNNNLIAIPVAPVTVRHFGAVGDGSTNDAPAFQLAADSGWAEIRVPVGNPTYRIAAPVTITRGVLFVGDNRNRSYIERDYSPTVLTDGVFNFRGGSSSSGTKNITIVSMAGQTGGCLVSIVASASDTIGLYYFDNSTFTTTGNDTHNETIIIDGTAKTDAPIGVRGVDFVGCSVFGGATNTMRIEGTINFSFKGGGCFNAGGNAASAVVIDGVSAVKTQDFTFAPSNCTCPVTLDQASTGLLDSPNYGAVTNTANTDRIILKGTASSLQNNWINSSYITTNLGNRLRGSIFNTGLLSSIFNNSGVNMGSVGSSEATSVGAGQTFTFTTSASAKMFAIGLGGGTGAMIFADFASATISIISNPSGNFVASNTPTTSQIGIFKSANSHVISITNGTTGTENIQICMFGTGISASTDPS